VPQAVVGLGIDLSAASKHHEAALAFYKGMKVYPTPGDLMSIYDQTVSKASRAQVAYAASGARKRCC